MGEAIQTGPFDCSRNLPVEREHGNRALRYIVGRRQCVRDRWTHLLLGNLLLPEEVRLRVQSCSIHPTSWPTLKVLGTVQGTEVGMIKSRYDIPLEETMAFETVYPKDLQLDLSQKKEILDATGSTSLGCGWGTCRGGLMDPALQLSWSSETLS